MAERVWQCETCRGTTKIRSFIMDCVGCKKEICDNCGYSFAHCNDCAAGKTREELRVAANATGDYDFEPFDMTDPEEAKYAARRA